MPKPSLAQPAPSSVTKACRILRVLSQQACRLADLTQLTGLDKATILRILDTLQDEGFAERDAVAKRYSLGPEMRAAGASAWAGVDLRAIARPSLLRLANEFEDTVLLSLRLGNESVCLDLAEGRFPIRANYMNIGGRRPLGVGAGSLALLAWMPEEERAVMLEALDSVLATHARVSSATVRRLVGEARRIGYAMTLNVVVDRMGGIGVPVFGADGAPVAAISIAALSDRILGRREAIVAALRDAADACRNRLVSAPR